MVTKAQVTANGGKFKVELYVDGNLKGESFSQEGVKDLKVEDESKPLGYKSLILNPNTEYAFILYVDEIEYKGF